MGKTHNPLNTTENQYNRHHKITVPTKIKRNITIEYKCRDNNRQKTVKMLLCSGKATGK